MEPKERGDGSEEDGMRSSPAIRSRNPACHSNAPGRTPILEAFPNFILFLTQGQLHLCSFLRVSYGGFRRSPIRWDFKQAEISPSMSIRPRRCDMEALSSRSTHPSFNKNSLPHPNSTSSALQPPYHQMHPKLAMHMTVDLITAIPT